MISLENVFQSPYYFGEISLYDTKNILYNEPAQSYLFRKLNNGVFTVATLQFKYLYEVEIKDCNCKGTLLPLQRFTSLKNFVEHCNDACKDVFGQKSIFCLPVKRKFALSLQEI